MRYSIIICIAAFLMTACGNGQKNPSMESSPMMNGFPASSDNTELEVAEKYSRTDSPELYGTYTGILPAASGEGVKTTLKLYNDHTYLLESEYIGRSDSTFRESGKYSLIDSLLTLQTSHDNQYYRLANGFLSKLDNNQKTITGEFEEHYQLVKE